MTDPFPLTPPSPEESARVVSEAALLTAAADRLEQIINADPSLLWLMDLIPLLRDAAREATEVGSNGFAVALARRIMGEGGRSERAATTDA